MVASGVWAAKAVIFDLDGLLVDTETLCREVAETVCKRHGRRLTPEAQVACIGKRPVEAWQSLIDVLGLQNTTGEELYAETERILYDRFPHAKALPGALRLLRHIKAAGVPLGLATSSERRGAMRKMEGKGIADAFDAIVCGDEVQHSKPAPDVYVECARQLRIDPQDVLVLEDAPSGVRAAAAAGMRVVVVPSVRQRESYPEVDPSAQAGPVQSLTSLLDFRPEDYGLPTFTDAIEGTVPVLPPWRLKGPVVKGFGRGSAVLGIPTANLDLDAIKGSEVGDAVCGIYYGLASVGSEKEAHVMAMSIGYNPVFDNEAKTVEPWILHDYGRQFHGEEIRLLVCGYIRPEANFPSLDALIERIKEDGRVAQAAMAHDAMKQAWADPFLRAE